MEDILDIIESALALEGYEVLASERKNTLYIPNKDAGGNIYITVGTGDH